ncbi:MAG: CDP-diacylglycerol--glycerol-3-phosphate 3-phosphatidyltransferase [Clostridia bacterium]|nr:CDP-diacylglycerol--glycerol-3-phosphate 3-phosphatidyltransferase [Clostridia bacterium]
MNLPNKLTVLRICLVPVLVLVLLLPVNMATTIIGAFIFLATAITDLLDGKIARKYGLVTDFGKFLDPLADKFMVLSAMMCIMYRSHSNELIFNIFMILVMVTIFRELAVASIRLVAVTNANIVVAANILGKVKTVAQIVCVMAALLEPVLSRINFLFFLGYYPITIAASVVTLVMTVWSGVVYLKTYWKYLDKRM